MSDLLAATGAQGGGLALLNAIFGMWFLTSFVASSNSPGRAPFFCFSDRKKEKSVK